MYITVSYGKVVGKARQYQYWQPALYEHYVTKEGNSIFKYVQHIGVARRSAKLAKLDAKRLAEEYEYIFVENHIRNNTPMDRQIAEQAFSELD